ncbi:NADH-quinone oxidoreductase subunit C [Aliikangiella sp. G2MR2-5]|uniref:NADH-quinone oxidoreductase subunit C n=1 Tax=Aliikangiella sp. G2MR2-5 TaxID=2788943 RepID=UPI0018AAEE27|nr:NADH-quinone oxidoreductase subunit C [Aliikangiella sp. G2MR2-5]
MSQLLMDLVDKHFADKVLDKKIYRGQLTIEVDKSDLLSVCETLRDNDDFQFEQLIDLCGVDYLTYGQDEWSTHEASGSGFERGRASLDFDSAKEDSERRFAVVYHLLSVTLNHRIRVRVFADSEDMMVPSVIDIWNGVNWFEREAFDLFGILFEGHPDLRRILTDYGFIGHPFRKDFPVVGELEMRYDEEQEQCVYEPVTIEERILVPRVIR